jgi:DoxX-like family
MDLTTDDGGRKLSNMSIIGTATERSKAAIWGGRVLSALPVLMLTMSATMKLTHAAQIVEGWKHFGFPDNSLTPIGIAEILCVILYVVPRTAVLGAILMTGYLGGAIATHVHAGEGFVPPLLLGIFAWGGLFLRDARFSALLPLRTPVKN